MSTDALTTLLPTLNAIPAASVKSPSSSVDTFLGKCELLYTQANADRADLLTANGFNPEYIDSLPTRISALRSAEATWQNIRYTSESSRKIWLDQSPAAFKLRDGLLLSFRYIFRKKPDVLKVVSDIADGTGNDDMLLDLSRLADLGNKHLAELQAVSFDVAKLATAAATSESLSKALADSRNESAGESVEIDIRNRAYTYCKEAVDEVLDAGKFVFHENADKCKHYYRTEPKTTKPKPPTPPNSPEVPPVAKA